MKRCMAALLCLVLLVPGMVGSFAAAGALVYADAIHTKEGETITIPVKISNNPGIMGFRLTVSFDKSVLSVTNVERGELTGSGMFNDSITDNTENSFDVLWSGTDEVKTDGSLFSVTFKVDADVASGEYDIHLSYDKNDTFNESWQNVELKTSSVKITITDENGDPGDSGDKDETDSIFIRILKKIAAFFVNVIRYIKSIFTK